MGPNYFGLLGFFTFGEAAVGAATAAVQLPGLPVRSTEVKPHCWLKMLTLPVRIFWIVGKREIVDQD